MPQIYHKYLKTEGELGLWKIEEDEFFFLRQMSMSKVEKEQLDKIKGHRRLEWLASRWLLHKMSGRKYRAACLKDEFGKPYLQNSLFEISISHSHGIAAVIAAPVLVGIDIQKIVEKINRIAHKFMRPIENENLIDETKLSHLHVYWGAKEALYKAYGRRALDFKQHIHIEPFEFTNQGGQFVGKIIKDEYFASFQLWYELIDDFVLVYAKEDIGDQRIV